MPMFNMEVTLNKGDLVDCPECGEKHPLRPDDEGGEIMLFITCPRSDRTYIMAFNHHPFLPKEE